MPQNALYQMNQDKVNPNHYICTKLDADYEVLETYHISVIGEYEAICTCPAGAKSKCRHRTMLLEFRKQKLVGQNWCYNFDQGKWIAPLNALEVDK